MRQELVDEQGAVEDVFKRLVRNSWGQAAKSWVQTASQVVKIERQQAMAMERADIQQPTRDK